MKKSNFSSIESIIKTVKKNGMFILVGGEKMDGIPALQVLVQKGNNKYDLNN